MPINVEPVRLKPLFGMPAGVYLTVLYALIIVVVLFLVAFLPGILNSGKRVTFTSDTSPVSVSVDGIHLGTAPVTAFIEPGSHEAVYSFGDALHASVPFEVSHPVFLTWLFPRSQRVVSKTLFADADDFSRYLESMFDETVAWSAVSTDARYHRPPLIMQAAESALHSGLQGIGEPMYRFLSSLALHIGSTDMLQEFGQAFSLLEDSDIFTARQKESLTGDLAAIGDIFSGKEGKTVGLAAEQREIPFSRTALSVDANGFSPIIGFSYSGGRYTKGTVTDRSYPAILEMGVLSEVESFSIAALETTEYQWARFIEANPYWAKTNITRLVQDGMVDENYLAGIFPTVTVMSNRPIRNISWYAAEAYTRWLSETSGRQVFLPSEAQWETAASSVRQKPYLSTTVAMVQSDGPSGMLGGYWEFTGDDHVPLARYLGREAAFTSLASDVVVKGGSYLNDPARITSTIVGILGRAECSETAGFRVAWTE